MDIPEGIIWFDDIQGVRWFNPSECEILYEGKEGKLYRTAKSNYIVLSSSGEVTLVDPEDVVKKLIQNNLNDKINDDLLELFTYMEV